MSLACQVARCQVSRAREISPLALATSLARDRDMGRDLEGRKLTLARHRDTGRAWEDLEDTPYEVGAFSRSVLERDEGYTVKYIFDRISRVEA